MRLSIFPAAQRRRYLKIFGITLVVLFIVILITFQVASRLLKKEIANALGPSAEIQELNIGLTGVEIVGIRLPAAPNSGWPAAHQLQADRILITPSLKSLFGGHIALSSIHVERGYLSMRRPKKGGIQVLPTLLSDASHLSAPSLARQHQSGRYSGVISAIAVALGDMAAASIKTQTMAQAPFSMGVAYAAQAVRPSPVSEKKPQSGNSSLPEISIDHIALENSVIDFFDASVKGTPVKIRLEEIKAALDHLSLPDLKGKSAISLQALVKGKSSNDGQLRLDGWMELASKDSDLRLQLKGVELALFQSYLMQSVDAGVRKGTMNLDLRSKVNKGMLNAPGTLTLNDFELSSRGRDFMGMPRALVISLMKDKKGQINIQFVLEGNINDPRFSLNENLAERFAVALAQTLGIDFKDLIQGIGKTLSEGTDSLSRLLRR